jgi:hypothetical protein
MYMKKCLFALIAIMLMYSGPVYALHYWEVYNGDYINTAYHRAFGRDATAAEVKYWDRDDVRKKFVGEYQEQSPSDKAIGHQKAMEASQNKLVTQLKRYFVTPEGGPELQATIERSYKTAFNRLPTPQEFAYWQNECKTKNMGYEDLIRAHQKWEQSGVKADERLTMIKRAYSEVYGRDAEKKEIDYSMVDIPKKGIIYDQLCNYLKDWTSGGSREQIKELENIVRRAYSKASVSSGPNTDQMRTAMNYVTSKRPFFQELVDWVKKTNTLNVQVAPPSGTTPVKVPSFKK